MQDYWIDADVDDLWQILGSKCGETLSCPAILQLDLGSSTSSTDVRRVALDDVVLWISELPVVL